MSSSRPRASELPFAISIDATTPQLVSAFSRLPIRVFRLSDWLHCKKVTAALARSHPLYAIILRGQSVARRSTDSAVRRLEDILAWKRAFTQLYGSAAEPVIEARLRRGAVRAATRKKRRHGNRDRHDEDDGRSLEGGNEEGDSAGST